MHAPSVPRYRSKWQDHVGTSALRCRSLASYVPLCSDLSESASCTAACIAGRQSHCRLHAFSAMMVSVSRAAIMHTKTGTPAIAEMPATSILYSINPLSFKSISISVPRTFFNTTLSISFSLKDNLMSVIGFLSMA